MKYNRSINLSPVKLTRLTCNSRKKLFKNLPKIIIFRIVKNINKKFLYFYFNKSFICKNK